MRSNAPQNHPPFPAARVKHTAHASTGTTSAAVQHAHRYSCTCTLFTRPRVTRSMIHPAQLHVLYAMCISAGAVASRWHAVATQRNMRRIRTHGGYSAKMEARGGSAACRRCLLESDRCAKTCASALMSGSGRMICARSCAVDSSLPSATRATDAHLPVRRLVNERGMGNLEEEDENLAPIQLQEGDFAKWKHLRSAAAALGSRRS